MLSGNNLRQVVHTHASVVKQYKLIPVKERRCPMAGKVVVGLASHWPCITDLSGLSTYGFSGLVRETVTLPVLSKGLGWLLDNRVSLDILGIQTLFYRVLFSAASEPVAETIENYHRDCTQQQQLSAGSVLPPDIFMKLQFGGDSRVSYGCSME